MRTASSWTFPRARCASSEAPEDRLVADDVLSVDALERMVDVPCDPARTRRRDVAALFLRWPSASGSGRRTTSPRACARCRAAASCARWTLDGIDAGHNLSSLGMTFVLYLLRAVVGRAGAAWRRVAAAPRSLAVHVDAAYRLVDPCLTLCNFFVLSARW